MDVRLPDGTIVTNVPEGITQAELMRRLQRTNGPSANRRSRRDEIAQALNEFDPTEGMSPLQKGLASLGAGFADLGLGVKQIYTDMTGTEEEKKALRQQVEEKRLRDKKLTQSTDLGVAPDWVPTIGETLKGAAQSAPLMALPAGGALGTAKNLGMSVLGGTLAGAIDPLGENDSRAMNIAKGAGSSAVLPLATMGVKGASNMVTRAGGQRRAADEIGKSITPDGANQREVLSQTLERLRQAQGQQTPANIPLSTAARLRDAELARLEAGSRARSGANWYDFDQTQAASVADALRRATSSADELAKRKSLRASNYATNRNQAMSTINDDAFNEGVMQLRARLDDALMSADASNPSVRNMLQAVRAEIDRVGADFGPDHLATIRANLSSKYNPLDPNVFKSAPRDVPATQNLLGQVDDILNKTTNNRWSNAVQGYARDSDAVRAAQAAGKVRSAFWDAETGRVLGVAADAAGDVPKITEAGLGRALNAARGPDKSLMMSNEANTRLNAVLEALRAQGIVQGVKRSATAGGGSNTTGDKFAAETAGAAANAFAGVAGGPAGAIGKGALDSLRDYANRNKDRALAEALQNPDQMIRLLEQKLKSGEPLKKSEESLLMLLRGASVSAATSN